MIIEVLGSIGILKGTDDGAFHPEKPVTRGEFAAIITRAVRLEEAAVSAAGDYFNDTQNHWARGYINLAAQMGYVSGDGDGAYRPDDTVTYEQAVKIMVGMTGYQDMAELKGGYPVGHILMAAETGIAKRISLPMGTEMNRGQVAQLLYDAMNAQLRKPVYYSDDGSVIYEKDGSLMDEFASYTRTKGIVTAVKETSISDELGTDAEDQVVIRTEDEKLRVYIGSTNARELLGREVRFHTTRTDSDEDDCTLLYIEPTDKNKTVSFGSEDVARAEPGKGYTYYRENGTGTGRITFDSDAAYIYNGEYTPALTESEMKPESGRITALDNDGDGKYEVIFIEAYRYLLVSAYQVEDGVPTLYFKPGANAALGQLELDPSDFSRLVSVYQNGDRITPDGNTVIDKWTSAAVAVSKTGRITLVSLWDETVTGTVTSTREEKNQGTLYTVDGKEYECVPGFSDQLIIGNEYTLQISFDGKIAGINTDEGISSKEYALVLKLIWADGADEEEEQGHIRLLLKDGTVETYTVLDRVSINHSRVPEMTEAVLRGIGLHSLILFTLNKDGKISKIETADKSHVCTTTDGYIGYNKDKIFSLDASTDLYFDDVKPPTLGGDMKLNENTIVYDLSSSDEEEWGVGDYTVFSDDTVYTVDAYDLDEYKTAKVIVSYGSTVEEKDFVNWSEWPLLIESVCTALSDQNMVTYEIIGMQNGKRISLFAKDMDVTDEEGENYLRDMTPGSVIQIKKNMLGEITKIRKLYKAPTTTMLKSSREQRRMTLEQHR